MINETKARIQELKSLLYHINNAPNPDVIANLVDYKIKFYESMLEIGTQQNVVSLAGTCNDKSVNSFIENWVRQNVIGDHRLETVFVHSKEPEKLTFFLVELAEDISKKSQVLCFYDPDNYRFSTELSRLAGKNNNLSIHACNSKTSTNLNLYDWEEFSHIIYIGKNPKSRNMILLTEIYQRFQGSESIIPSSITVILPLDKIAQFTHITHNNASFFISSANIINID